MFVFVNGMGEENSLIVILANEGQMCNQLLTLAAAYSLGLEYDESVICPIMSEKLKKDFAFYDNSINIDVKMYESRFWVPIVRVVRVIKKILKISAKAKYDVKRRGKIQIFTDWIPMKDAIVFAKHQPEIRRYFGINPQIEAKCTKLIGKIRDNESILVGVHIRRGDYKTFNSGDWYYTDEEYLNWMKSLSKEVRVKFVLFSNEPLDLAKFTDSNCEVVKMEGNAVEDLCCMSKCDYIMGPPSTYSWWAAMYGNCKRLILENRNMECSWDDFMYLEERAYAGTDDY